MIDALDMDPDDATELLYDIERAFGIAVGEAEAAGCHTVGDLFAVVCAQVATIERGDGLPCLTAPAFRALRRAARARRPGLELRPGTAVASFAGRRDHRAWHAHLVAATGLAVVPPTVAPLALLAAAAAFAAAALLTWLGLEYGGVGPTAVALVAAGIEGACVVKLLDRCAPRRWDAGITLGDLATLTAAHGVARFVEAHGAVRRRDAWRALLALTRLHVRRTGQIGPGTRFYAEGR